MESLTCRSRATGFPLMEIAYEVGDRPQRLVRQPQPQCAQEQYRLGIAGVSALPDSTSTGVGVSSPIAPIFIAFIARAATIGTFRKWRPSAKGQHRGPDTPSLYRQIEFKPTPRLRPASSAASSPSCGASFKRSGNSIDSSLPLCSWPVLLRGNPNYITSLVSSTSML